MYVWAGLTGFGWTDSAGWGGCAGWADWAGWAGRTACRAVFVVVQLFIDVLLNKTDRHCYIHWHSHDNADDADDADEKATFVSNDDVGTDMRILVRRN